MKRYFDAKLGMYKAVNDTLTANATTITAAAVPIITTYKTDLGDYIEAIQSKSEEATKKTLGITQTKKEARFAAIKSAVAIAGAMYSYWIDTNNTEMAIVMNISSSTLKAKKDEEVLDELNNIAAEAHDLVTVVAPAINPLANYGVSALEVTALQELIIAYNAITTAPRVAISTIKTKNLELANLYTTTDNLLVKFDKIIDGLQDSFHDFWAAYFNARQIVGPMTLRTQIVGTVSKITDVELMTTATVQNAEITIIAAPYVREKNGQTIQVIIDPMKVKTDVEGKYTRTTPDLNTTYTIICKLPGYAEQQITGVMLNKGKKTQANFLMEPVQSGS